MLIMSSACAIPRNARAQQRDLCATAIPSNIDAGIFTRDVIALLSRSETFRSQCERVAGTPRVRVTLAIVSTLNGGRAQTAIHRFPSGAILAEVDVLFGENYRELLAHEFEHILEQIEGVDLRQEAAQGRAWLLPGGAFETRRAYLTGVQVSTESEPMRARRAAASVHATR
jgi:hypothetical protein